MFALPCSVDGVVVTKPALRIVSLAPNLTAMIKGMGAVSELVGTVKDPPIKNIPVVASANSINVESVIALRPDWVVTWGNSANYQSSLEKLKSLGIKIYNGRAEHILDIQQVVLNLGCLTGRQAEAKRQADRFGKTYQILQQHSSLRPVGVFYQIWDNPLTTLNTPLINEAIALCGGKNVFEKDWGAAPEVSVEQVIEADPQVIIHSGPQSTHWKKMWYSTRLPAAEKGHLFSIEPRLLQQATPAFLEQGVNKLCNDIDKARGDHDTAQ